MKYNYILVLTAWNACFLDMSKVQIYIIRCFEFWHEFFLLSGIRWQHNWFGHHFLIWTKFNGDSVAVSKWYVLATIYLHIANVLPANNQLSKLHERQNFSSSQVKLLVSYNLVEIWLIDWFSAIVLNSLGYNSGASSTDPKSLIPHQQHLWEDFKSSGPLPRPTFAPWERKNVNVPIPEQRGKTWLFVHTGNFLDAKNLTYLCEKVMSLYNAQVGHWLAISTFPF